MTFKDFVPKRMANAGVVKFLGLSLPTDTFESFEDCVRAAGQWIETNKVDVISVETVVLPNIYAPHEEGPTDPALGVRGDFPAFWYQFVRVWHR